MISSHVTFLFQHFFSVRVDRFWKLVKLSWFKEWSNVVRWESEVCILRIQLLLSSKNSYLINGLMNESIYPNEGTNSLRVRSTGSLDDCSQFLQLGYVDSVNNVYSTNENMLHTFIFNLLCLGWPAFPVPIRWIDWVIQFKWTSPVVSGDTWLKLYVNSTWILAISKFYIWTDFAYT